MMVSSAGLERGLSRAGACPVRRQVAVEFNIAPLDAPGSTPVSAEPQILMPQRHLFQGLPRALSSHRNGTMPGMRQARRHF